MDDDRYIVRLITRCRVDGTLFPVGTKLKIPSDRLRVASHLCRTGAARPFDEQTARDVELHQRLQATLPRA